jgi:hypothetical protein
MFESEVELLDDGQIRKYSIHRDMDRLSYAEVIELWQRDETFRTFFIALLSDAPFSAFRWETPPVTLDTTDQDFEFVLLDSPWLAGFTEQTAFAREFASADPDLDVITFPNLGNDALLVVPCERGLISAYCHIAAFTREAPEKQNHSLWMEVGKGMEGELGDEPVWLSTAGGGVDWVHVRLDSWPKYYGYQPYKEAL